MFYLLNILLVDRPRQSLAKLEGVFVDEVLTLPVWIDFITTEITRWTNIASQVSLWYTRGWDYPLQS